MRLDITEARQLCLQAALKLGLSKADAQAVVEEHIYGELTGKSCHGLAAFSHLPEMAKTSKGRWKIIREKDCYALIDGRGNMGQLVGRSAMELAIKKARNKGIAIVAVRKMQPYLMPEYYAKIAADSGMVGIVLNNCLSRVAPFGGIEPRLGTNPIAVGIPTNGEHFLLGMATATRAAGQARLAKKLGTLLPKGMALDVEGKPTRDPDSVKALTPCGAYKGYGLGLAVEIMAGAMIGARMGSCIKDDLDRGFLFIAINPAVFTDVKRFRAENSALVREIKSAKKAQGTDEILIAGERARGFMRRNLERGYFELEPAIAEGIRKML